MRIDFLYFLTMTYMMSGKNRVWKAKVVICRGKYSPKSGLGNMKK